MPDWDVSKVTDMERLFEGYSNFNKRIHHRMGHFSRSELVSKGRLGMSHLTDMSYMFQSANAFTQDLSDWDTSSLTRLYEIFYSSHANPKISNWDVSKVTNMDRVFDHAYSFNQDISSWDVSSVTRMNHMFYNAQKFNQNLNGWDTSRVRNMEGMFWNANAFNGAIDSWDVRA